MKHLIERTPGNYVIGEEIQTRGEDERFPTFRLEDGSLLGVKQDKVKPFFETDSELLSYMGTDATRWAEQFCMSNDVDEGLMISWFANAIEAGKNA